MSNTILLNISQTQTKRLSHIDFRLNFLGSISRKDLMTQFGIKEAAATRDITLYKARAANEHGSKNIEYDKTLKIYSRTQDFVPIFDYSVNQVLKSLSEGFEEGFMSAKKALIPCDIPIQLNKPSLAVLSVLSRAIYQKKVVNITYRSMDSGKSSREIVPLALVFNGLRWHVRVYDRKRDGFGDFVLTRISKPFVVDSPIQEKETRDFDIQWNRIVEMELIAHPRLKHRKSIEHDYGMEEGVLKINARAAIAGYVLRVWNVDCSEKHTLKGGEIQLCLRNVAALYGVKSAKLAPGYKSDS